MTTTQKGCCNACDKPIVGQVITALGKTWHPEHFTCNHCSQELGTRNFFERDGHPYCEPDYHNLFSPRCAYCNGAILDVRIAGERYIILLFSHTHTLIMFRNASPHWRKRGTRSTSSAPSAASSLARMASTSEMASRIVATTTSICLRPSATAAIAPSWRTISQR